MLADRIRTDLTTAMKAGESLRVSVLRMLLSELNYKKIDLQRELLEEDVAGVIRKEAKKRREAIESYRTGGREEQARVEEEELAILAEYLPKQMAEAEIRGEVIKLIESLSTKEKADFGKVMKVVSPVFRGRADGGMVAMVVRELIES